METGNGHVKTMTWSPVQWSTTNQYRFTCLVACWASSRSISSIDDSLAYRLTNSLAYVCMWSENTSHWCDPQT